MWGIFRWRRHHLQNEANRRTIAALPGRHDRFIATMQAREVVSGIHKAQAGKKLSKRERTALHAHVMENYRRA